MERRIAVLTGMIVGGAIGPLGGLFFRWLIQGPSGPGPECNYTGDIETPVIALSGLLGVRDPGGHLGRHRQRRRGIDPRLAQNGHAGACHLLTVRRHSRLFLESVVAVMVVGFLGGYRGPERFPALYYLGIAARVQGMGPGFPINVTPSGSHFHAPPVSPKDPSSASLPASVLSAQSEPVQQARN